MKNKYFYFLIFIIFVFIFNMRFCYAALFNGTIIKNGVYLRVGPGTNYDYLKTLTKGNVYRLVNDTLYQDEKGCANGWYKIYYEGSDAGYICSDNIELSTVVYNETPTTDCENKLSDLGFPSSYWEGLCTLNETYPSWQFTPVFTGLDWSEAVDSESACDKSYIASDLPTNIDTSCKNRYTSTWYPASSTAVAYYMDPRNFFTEKYIFQFEHLKYNEALTDYYYNASVSAIDHAAFYKYHLNLGNDLGNVLTLAGKDNNISPIFLASRILQEMGSKEKLYNLYSGVYAEAGGIYLGFYNFYNFAVTDKCATTDGPTICGLKYAKEKGWDSLYNGIAGGASKIRKSYIEAGQYNGYFQKFNLVPKDSSLLYFNQYMTNIQAPSSESKTTYNSYKALGILDKGYIFYIPVFNNMDDSNYSDNSGAVDTPDNNTPSTMDISTIITSSGYKYTGEMITGISPDTTVESLKSGIESIAGGNTVKIKNQNDTLVTEGLVGTGFKVTVNNSSAEETLTVVINGDTSGDGLINALDLLQVHKNILGTYTLSGAYKLAGDTSDDGKVDALDLLQVHKNILGTYKIEQ